MGLSMKVIASILLLLLGFTAITVSGDANNYYIKSTTKACCDKCYCSKSIPPKCYCADVGITCHSACKKWTLFVEEGKSSVNEKIVECVLLGGSMTNPVQSYHTHMRRDSLSKRFV
ncbi:hypothetical protein JHK87_026168 [Glycine soja]|nr:hypothetical protein JHK87_026168 [Glycine soja]